MPNQPGTPDYSALAETLAQISQARADYQQQDASSPAGPRQGASFGYAQDYNQKMQKVWDMFAHMGISKNSPGQAPQILDNQQELGWMKAALADPSSGGGVFSGGMLHTPKQTFTPDTGNTPRQDRAALDPRTGTINSNTGTANGVDPRTGMPYYTGTNAPPQAPPPPPVNSLQAGLIAKLAQSPQHAQGIANYLAMSGNGVSSGNGYNSNLRNNEDYMQASPTGSYD